MAYTFLSSAPQSLIAMCPEELQTLIDSGAVSQVPPEEVDNKIL